MNEEKHQQVEKVDLDELGNVDDVVNNLKPTPTIDDDIVKNYKKSAMRLGWFFLFLTLLPFTGLGSYMLAIIFFIHSISYFQDVYNSKRKPSSGLVYKSETSYREGTLENQKLFSMLFRFFQVSLVYGIGTILLVFIALVFIKVF